MLVTITNKKTGETKQVDDSQLNNFGLSQSDVQSFKPPITATNTTPSDSMSQDDGRSMFRQGVLGWLTNQLPTIGSIGGSILGGTAGTAVAPGVGTVGGAAAGGAAGGAGGEALKEWLQGTKANSSEIGKQALFGGIGGAAGEVARPILGAAAEFGSKLPIVGTAIKSLSDLGDSALMKIFGAGDVEAGSGVKELVTTAKNYGLHNANGIEEVASKTLAAQDAVGKKLGSFLAKADEQGAGTTLSEVEKMLTESKPLTEGSTLAKTVGKKGFAQDTLLSGPKDYVNKVVQKGMEDSVRKELGLAAGEALPSDVSAKILSDIQTGEANVPASTLNELKQYFAKQGNFGGENPSDIEKLARSFSSKLKGTVEDVTQGVGNVKQLNRDWWNLEQIKGNVGKVTKQAFSSGGGRSPIGPGALFRTPASKLLQSKVISAAPDIAAQGIIRNGQTSQTDSGGLPTNPNDVNFPGQQNQIKAEDIDVDGRLKVNPQAQYSKQQLENGIIKALNRGDTKSASRYKTMYDTLYPKVKAPAKPSNTIQGRILNAFDALSNSQSQLPADPSQVQFAQ